MRTFIVIGLHDVLNQDRPDITFDQFRANNIVELLEATNKKYGKDTIIYEKGRRENSVALAWRVCQDYEERTEFEILSQIYESNGDGDWRWIIAEVKIIFGQPEATVILD